jgi:hypothetical protein
MLFGGSGKGGAEPVPTCREPRRNRASPLCSSRALRSPDASGLRRARDTGIIKKALYAGVVVRSGAFFRKL